MTVKTLEDVINVLNEQQKVIEEQKKEIQRLEDIHEIQNLMGKYIYMHEVSMDPQFWDKVYALKTPGVSAEVAHMGAFVGEESLGKFFTEPPQLKDKRGLLFTHPLTTPVIEVAGDGKTAKGLWMSPGYETIGDPETGKFMGCFAYTKYGCDFAKEDGKWKVWHYHVYRIFMTPWNKPFTEDWELKIHDKEQGTPSPFGRPDQPTTYDQPYSTETERELVPAPPEPYETFNETFSYGPPEKK